MTKNALQSQEHVVTPTYAPNLPCFTPRVDILETEEELLLFADLPGVKPEDLDLHFEGGELRLHGRCAPRFGERPLLAEEYGVGDFYRAFSINEKIAADKISAELKQGVLTIHLPKTEEIKPRKIAIKS